MNWVTQSWWTLLPPEWAAISITAVALWSGAIVGAEREKREKPAGMRTLIFVCLGAAVFTMVGFSFTSSTGDSGRVAAQVVTGVGFLGAGVILHGRAMVSGATTAASIWLMASIGVVAGAGFGVAAFTLSALARLVLVGVRVYEYRFIERIQPVLLTVDFAPEGGKTRARLLRVLADFNVQESACRLETATDGPHRLKVTLRQAHRPLRELIDQIAEIEKVLEMQESPGNQP